MLRSPPRMMPRDLQTIDHSSSRGALASEHAPAAQQRLHRGFLGAEVIAILQSQSTSIAWSHLFFFSFGSSGESVGACLGAPALARGPCPYPSRIPGPRTWIGFEPSWSAWIQSETGYRGLCLEIHPEQSGSASSDGHQESKLLGAPRVGQGQPHALAVQKL